jgi:hypothetical protein
MKTVVIMQPTFLPWCGYFHLAGQSDVFVFLDDVQLEKQSWQTRNRLLVNKAPHWISVPIIHDNCNQSIAETKVKESSNWRAKLHRTFLLNYGNHPFSTEAQEIVNLILHSDSDSLAVINESVIEFIAEKLRIKANFFKSSSLQINKKRTDKLISICDYFQADVYLSPQGARKYLEADCFSERTLIKLIFQEFSQPSYVQKGLKDFIPNMSILDMVANIGFDHTSELIRA